ncbi:hypothetical protein [Streptosporangium roseum]|uniref:Uncharacterized protein n=1 Tax=Streptosporangium roseum (strain ATCC 12428 / DSM 43021 / JCM 3005 / KCTC 9067 / NCIMB 10171 / NRRL 2505 / NI 9100) TaxID=479432 RepID=D2AUG9_STRRD|nr:hypothetical protein [Streptosporangium roseum]ACZ84831.1 hypothetical protein Sros_1843 [Streptosporangium roseum DSM 43021]
MSPQELAVALARRWKLAREDLDHAADALGVARVTDEEWAEMSEP